MKSTLLAAGLALAVLCTPNALQADDGKSKSPSLVVPVTSAAGVGTGKFVGEFRINEFAARGNEAVAVGLLVGTVSDLNGVAQGTVVKNVAIPVARNAAKASSTNAAAIEVAQNGATCEILNLVLGPIDLNLLGLRLRTNQIVIELDAVSGPGNLLGNLLCAVVNLLNGGSLANLLTALNNLLALLAAL
ncbi:MAG TPA: hypothetical protein VES20_18790 [Bryobacteraceae bacterium]|nr:hypothetical protein [Bryobacteraceae bacterium]